MLIKDRVKLILKSQNMTASEFADSIDVKRSNLSHVLSGRNKPSLDFLEKLLNTYPNVNASWLITGETREGEFEEAPKKEVEQSVEDSRSEASFSTGENDDRIEKVLVFYKDGTFKEYQSRG